MDFTNNHDLIVLGIGAVATLLLEFFFALLFGLIDWMSAKTRQKAQTQKVQPQKAQPQVVPPAPAVGDVWQPDVSTVPIVSSVSVTTLRSTRYTYTVDGVADRVFNDLRDALRVVSKEYVRSMRGKRLDYDRLPDEIKSKVHRARV